MRRILCAAVIAYLYGGYVQASDAVEAADSIEFGVLKVPSGDAQTIVAVPWLASGTGSENVKVTNLVLTAGLTEGDELKYYNSSEKKYECWKLNADKQWIPSIDVTGAGDIGKIAAADQKALPRGEALLLKRTGDAAALSSGFYVMGKPYVGSGTSLTLPATGSPTAPVYALVAPPNVSDTSVNDFTWTGLRPLNDQLVTPAGGRLTWLSTSKWSGNATTQKIVAGTGVWFVSRSEGAKSVTW